MVFVPWMAGGYWEWCSIKARSGNNFGVFKALQDNDGLGGVGFTKEGNYMILYPFEEGKSCTEIDFRDLDGLLAQCVIYEMLEK